MELAALKLGEVIVAKAEDNFDDIVTFHGNIDWYSADTYSPEVLKKLKKTKVTTYKVTVGNTTVHYFSHQLPKKEDFDPSINSEAKKKPLAFWKKLNDYIQASKYFIKDKKTAKLIDEIEKSQDEGQEESSKG